MEKIPVEWKTVCGKECLYFKFGAFLAADAARDAIAAWKTAFDSRPSGTICLIWDCLDMKNYDKDARIAWQQAINEHKARIGAIWVVTKSVVITVGAGVLSTFTAFKINTVASLDDIKCDRSA